MHSIQWGKDSGLYPLLGVFQGDTEKTLIWESRGILGIVGPFFWVGIVGFKVLAVSDAVALLKQTLLEVSQDHNSLVDFLKQFHARVVEYLISSADCSIALGLSISVAETAPPPTTA